MSGSTESGVPLRAIAIVGMACRVPGGADVDELWQTLREGREAISVLSDAELAAAGVDPALFANPEYVRARGVLPGADLFDAPFFGFSPRDADLTDPQQRVFLECAWTALEDAGFDPSACPGSVGVYAGAGWNSYQTFNLAPGGLLESDAGHQILLGNEKDHLATRVSYRLDLRGPSVCVQTACSTSLVATAMACQALLGFQCDMALAGGVSILFPQGGHLYRPGGILSPDGRCRAFDADAEGTVMGSGAGVVVLRRLEDALADGDPIHAVILASAVNNDGGARAGYTAPGAEGQARCIFEAHSLAGVPAESITCVEAHGTGTALGDPIEVAALTAAFRQGTESRGFCALGSVKTNLGHLDAAAGVTGLIKTALALAHREIPPSLHFRTPNPRLHLAETPFYVNAALAPWTSAGGPRRAGVSSFGLGGTNAHLVLEEAPPPEPGAPDDGPQLLLLSARTPAALAAAAARLAAHLRRNPGLALADVAHTLRTGRKAFAHRCFVVCRSVAGAAAALEAGAGAAPPVPASREPPVAFLFTGQGAQHVDMGRALYDADPVFRREANRCLDFLAVREGLDLRPLLYPAGDPPADSADALRQTGNAQPALFVVEYALARAWMARGVEMESAIGHSIGEYVAATLAGVFDLEDALSLVGLRGRLMQALPAGAMLAVPLPETEVEALLGPELCVAAVNTPSSCVVSGPTEAVAALRDRLEARGVEARLLHTSHAFHSPMMEPALGPFGERVASVRLRAPRIPFVSNVTGGWITDAQATDPGYWVRHLRAPVRFAQGLRTLTASEERVLLEVGPGRTLAQLARRRPGRAPGEVVLASLPQAREGRPGYDHFLETLGALWAAGVPIRRDPGGEPGRRRVRLPTYPFERQRYWIDPPRRVPGAVPAYPKARWRGLADAAAAAAEHALAGFDLARHRARRETLDALALACLDDGVRRLWAAGDAAGDALPARLGIIPRYEQLFGSILSTLEASGTVRMEDGAPTLLAPPAGDGLDVLFARAMDAWRDAPAVPALARACAEALPAVLRGKREPLELFADVVEQGQAPQLAESSLEGCYRRVLRAGVERLVVDLPHDTLLRVVEIGGGTGIATEGLLPALPPGRTSYAFTDAGRSFLDGARKKFAAFPFLRFGVLDIEKPPAEQGYPAGGFDVAVAVNVLHVTRDMGRTLRHVRSLLAPGGVLLLWEITRPTPDFELTYGLLMNPPEDGGRSQGRPFLSPGAWKEALRANGFDQVATIPPDDDAFGEHVLLARATDAADGAQAAFSARVPAGAGEARAYLAKKADVAEWFHVPSWQRSMPPALREAPPGERWLVLAAGGDAGSALASAAARRGVQVATARPGERFGRSEDGGFTLDPACSGDYRRLLATLRDEGRRPTRVVHAWGAAGAPLEPGAELWRLLLLVQALGDSDDQDPVDLTVVSSGIHEVTGEESVDPERALVLAPCRVIPLEYPQVACRSVDVPLPSPGETDAVAELLFREILAGGADPVVAYRRGHRWLQGVEPVRLPAPDGVPAVLKRNGVYLVPVRKLCKRGEPKKRRRRRWCEADEARVV